MPSAIIDMTRMIQTPRDHIGRRTLLYHVNRAHSFSTFTKPSWKKTKKKEYSVGKILSLSDGSEKGVAKSRHTLKIVEDTLRVFAI